MSEEIKNPGMELNDVELEGVSGGLTRAEREKGKAIAKNTCMNCRKDGQGCSLGSDREQVLYNYLHENDHYIIYDDFWYNMCPFTCEPYV